MYKKILFILGASLFLAGCGGGGTAYSNETQQDARSNSVIQMQKGKKYDINSGDKIKKLTNYTRIKATGDRNSKKTTVELLDGSAEIHRGE